MNCNGTSILFLNKNVRFTEMPDTAFHDLGLDSLCKALTTDAGEQSFIKGVLTNMTDDPETAEFRRGVFADILGLPDFRKKIMELFDKLEFFKSFGTMSKKTDEKLGIWYLMHRLDEFGDYIKCVESMRELLAEADIKSEGLKAFGKYIDELYEDRCFAEMKKDISELKAKTSDIKSVTLGINVNERFDAVSMGLISVNNKPFKKSNIVSSFAEAVAAKSGIKDGNDWNGDMHYHEVDSRTDGRFAAFFEKQAGFMAMQKTALLDSRIRQTIVNMPDELMSSSTFFLEKVLNRMLDSIVKKLGGTLGKYVDVAVVNISRLIPEFTYYIRFAEFIEKYRAAGFTFNEAKAVNDGGMRARGFYNLKLAMTVEKPSDIVPNDLDFDEEHTVYILTGANRGGKTTVTQAVGLLFVLAQGGIDVPAEEFVCSPADCIFTHFPADEDKTIDLGRLGEECVRFKELYGSCTESSLLLLNESFSTTSFEEGYYIARDAVRAVLRKRTRTIFNTHMHKLAADISALNEGAEGAKASSLVVVSSGGERSFRVAVAEPEGMSYARDIAEKYGVTFEALTGEAE